MRLILVLSALVLASSAGFAQTPASAAPSATEQPDPPERAWHAMWVTHPTAPLRDPLVLHFKRTVDLPSVPSTYIIRVSADNRFILWVNGKRVGDGPARGDLTHWRYERFDLSPYLKSGKNLIAATVWNFGVYAPIAQFSDRTAFLLESEATGDADISTPKDWLVEEEPGHRPLDRTSVNILTYFASGPGEEIDSAHYDWNWDSASSSSSSWVPVASPMRDSIFPVNTAHSAEVTGDNVWGLIPDSLPHMVYEPTSPGTTVRASISLGEPFPNGPATIPANTHAHILLDRKTLTTAYPSLTVSGGKGATIWLTYSEALYDKDKHKGDRDEVGDRQALGLRDRFLPDGAAHRTFTPLWWRTWRYLDVEVTTGSQPVTLDSLSAAFTAYPFKQQATFESGDKDLDKIWDISWRTARLDAHETYMDTPYYEQLQYIGDTRIQALISYSVAGDDRLALQALQAFNNSRLPEGITRSRYPSSLPQNIPTFSLLWIGMLHDWWMYRPDPEPARQSLKGVRSVLGWFGGYEQPDGLLHQVPWWSFIDWVNQGETPTYDVKGESCIVSLHYLGALDDASDLERAVGDPVLADRDHARAAHVREAIYSKCWNATNGMLADNPDQKVFSQQSNILGVLYDVIPKNQQQTVLKKVFAIEPGETPNGVMSASYYFRFYLSRALDHAGMADDYLKSLDPWRKLLPLHFSTWPEQPGETRSDSHAWSAHPIYDLLTLVAGVEPASPAFATVKIAPHLGDLQSLKAAYPHPSGLIKVEYHKSGSGLDASIDLPGSLTGTFVYNGKTSELHTGTNKLRIQ